MFNEDRPATQAEAYREMVNNVGQDNPDHCWILTPFDTWERNPAYVGPEQPHPEFDDYHPENQVGKWVNLPEEGVHDFNKPTNPVGFKNFVDNDLPF